MLIDKIQPENWQLFIARHSIEYGVKQKAMYNLNPGTLQRFIALPEEAFENKATFVTLKRYGRLRGCIGSLHPVQPLYIDINANAFKAAFNDYRFDSLTVQELKDLDVSISILSSPEKLKTTSEEDLKNKLCVGSHGLILKDRDKKATFLPSVWQSLSDADEFVARLKQKAGWDVNYWSDTIEAFVYRVEEIS